MIATSPITITNDTMAVRFDRFGIDNYDLFLKVKRLPEYQVAFNEADESYTITAPARFASMLGVSLDRNNGGWLPFPEFLFDDQVAIISMALDAKRFACWSDCGLGKTLIQLEVARQVIHRTGGRFLLFTLNEIVEQTIEECQRWYGDTLPIHHIHTRAEMREWCKSGSDGPEMLAITNYEKMNHKGEKDQVVNELRYLAGVGLDESSRLKAGGGKQKWALIKSCKGIEYKLSCTATPAPNDTIEFASQASFLEKMRSDNDIIWTYFARDPKSHRWTVKRHARKAFFEFMAAWSIYVRSPKRYGWRLDQPEIPEPIVKIVDIDPTLEQIGEMQKLCGDPDGQLNLLDSRATNAIQRSKLSQVAKGFRYIRGESAGKYRRIPSRKPKFVAELAKAELDRGLQVLLWTVFDAESDIVAAELKAMGVDFDLLVGKIKEKDRLPILERFRHGESRLLISRAALLGYGQNFQLCGSMIFSGWNDSYESYYQAVRRAYRYGQTQQLRVHIPVVPILEGDMLENIFHKQEKHEAAIAEMEANYIKAVRRLRGEAK